jgi:hypothetical protein
MGRRMNWKNPACDRTGQYDRTKEHMKEWAKRPPPKKKKPKPTMEEVDKRLEMDRITMEKKKGLKCKE